MKLHFPWPEVVKALAEVRAATVVRPLYEQVTGKGLWLVGDMLDTFASVGAARFDVTFLDIDGARRGFRKGQSTMQLCNSLPKLLPGLCERWNNLIVRPHGDTATLVQLDDLNADALAPRAGRCLPHAMHEPGNHQARVAVSGPPDKDFARRLRKATGADPSASGGPKIWFCCPAPVEGSRGEGMGDCK